MVLIFYLPVLIDCVSSYGDSILSCSVWTKAVSHEAVELTRATPPEDVAGCDGIILHQRNCAYFQRDMVTW